MAFPGQFYAPASHDQVYPFHQPPRSRAICAALFVRRRHPGHSDFHWAIAILAPDGTTADLFHVTDKSGWVFERRAYRVHESQTLCALVQIGLLQPNITIDFIHYHLSQIPLSAPTEELVWETSFHCRIWFRQAIRTLGAFGIVHCSDVFTLEAECRRFAAERESTVVSGQGQYSYYVSNSSW